MTGINLQSVWGDYVEFKGPINMFNRNLGGTAKSPKQGIFTYQSSV